jgi:hypothetical protein
MVVVPRDVLEIVRVYLTRQADHERLLKDCLLHDFVLM